MMIYAGLLLFELEICTHIFFFTLKILKPTPGHTYGYCWKCFDIGEQAIQYWEPSDSKGFSQWKDHTKTQHKLMKKLECTTCNIQFGSKRNQMRHQCTKANQSAEFFTRYTLCPEGDVLQSLAQTEEPFEYTDPLSASQLYHLCFGKKIAVANAFPGIVKGKFISERTFLYK